MHTLMYSREMLVIVLTLATRSPIMESERVSKQNLTGTQETVSI